MRWWIIAAVAAILAGLLRRMTVKFKLIAAGGQCNILINFFILFSLIKIPLHLQLNFNRTEGINILRIKKNRSRKTLFPNHSEKSFFSEFFKALPITSYKSWSNLQYIHASLRLGTGDAKATALISGLCANIFETTVFALFYDDAPNVYSNISPDFENKIFILNMEGIIYLRHVKIILVTMKEIVKLKALKRKE